MKFKNDDSVNINGTSLKGYVQTTLRKLREVFGNPVIEEPSEYSKTGYEWHIEFEDGTVATVYDWKRYTRIPLGEDEPFEFNIGGHDAHAYNLVKVAMMSGNFAIW